jgi:hypothetical protein
VVHTSLLLQEQFISQSQAQLLLGQSTEQPFEQLTNVLQLQPVCVLQEQLSEQFVLHLLQLEKLSQVHPPCELQIQLSLQFVLQPFEQVV